MPDTFVKNLSIYAPRALLSVRMSEYHIEKNRSPVVVRTRSGEIFSGDIFLQLYGRHDGGGERPIDLLNSAEHFFPVRSNTGEIVILAKDQVVSVAWEDPSGTDENPLQTITKRVDVEVGLTDGETISATVLLEVPEDHPRLLDFLNLGKQRFMSLETTGGRLFVNRSMVERVRTMDEAGRSPSR
jgi:hypothetical protein